jgi:leukotriene-A4 hydrolase
MNQILRAGAATLMLACLSGPAAATGPDSDLAPIQPGLDYHSFANVEQFRVTHMELDLRVDFVNKVLFGAVALEIKRLDPRATELVLDTRDLDIRDVEEKPSSVLGALAKSETTWVSRPFHFDKKDPILGSPLVIELPPSKKSTQLIRIDYVTSPTAPALQWLTAKQTAGKPFMYTLAEPIGTRSWIPLQDTPQVRATYTAHIHTTSDVLAMMSAKNDPKVKRNGEYTFNMQEPIPSYLIALAVGDLRFKETGTRTGVYAQKPLLPAAALEFADAESMIRAAEKFIGPYAWDRFDIVVMPPGLPVGSMENPRLTFISPTVIAGDKSLTSAVARALAHSWSGDEVNIATWRDLWINEGFASFLASRIMNDVYGDRREGMERVLAARSFRLSFAKLKSQDQVLAIDLRDRDPAAEFNGVPAEKGRLFFTYLDAKFGRERFDAFLHGYFEHFASKTISTDQFLKYLDENLLTRFPGIVSRDQVTAWVTAPGIPADAVLPATNAFQPVDAVRSVWLDGKLPVKQLDTHDWLAQQWVYFLDDMPAELRKDQLADLDLRFAFTRSGNAEIARSWLMLVIRNGYQPGIPRLEEYLRSIGRRTLITPLYEELMKTPAGAVLAKRVYALAQLGYHPQTIAAIDPIVNLPSETQDDE